MSGRRFRNKKKAFATGPSSIQRDSGISSLDGSGSSGSGDPVSNRRTLSALTAYSYSGPLPPPEMLAKYNEVIPNGADRIVSIVENQSSHRHNLEKIVVGGNVESERRGQWMGLFLCSIVIIGGLFLAHEGKQITGFGMIVAELTALAGVFVYGKRSQHKELDKKKEQLNRK
jgi:uncharacterized membrane protein